MEKAFRALESGLIVPENQGFIPGKINRECYFLYFV